MNLKSVIISLLVLIILSNKVHAQSGAGIRGQIKSDEASTHLDAATISLLRSKDSSLVKISLADKDGVYEFQNLKAGSYLVMVTAVGYEKLYTAPITIVADKYETVTAIKLIKATKSLNEVNVAVKKPFIERKIDKVVLNVDAMISNAGSTALEVLEKAPGVSVDKDGNISLQGKQGVIIMMDGKPSYLSGQELTNLLKSMPSSALEQVEILTNPSAKYDASGNSGIINLRTRKNKMVGFNGNFSASYGQGVYARENSALNMNYRKNKINLFGNYSFSHWKNVENLFLLRNFNNQITKKLETVFEQNALNTNAGDFHNLKIGVDYYLDKRTSLGVVVSGYLNPSLKSGQNHTLLKSGTGIVDSSLVASNSSREKGSNFGANLNFRHIFDSTGKEVTADFDYLEYTESTHQNFLNNYYNSNGSTRKPSNNLRGELPSEVKIYAAKVDLTLPWKFAKIETGIKTSYVTTDNEASYANNYGAGWETDYGKTNHFIYKENINAAYVNASRQIKKLGIQAGLRLENTHAEGKQLGNALRRDSAFSREYTNLFPTVFLSYELNKKNNLSLNFGRRIDRPDYQDLNPFYYFLDDYTYQVGNTMLKPQFTNSFEVSHTYKGFLTTALNYSKTDDIAVNVMNQVTAERKTFVSKDNIASLKALSLSLSANFPITKQWNTNLYGNLINRKYNGMINGGNLDVSGTTFMANANNQFKFKKGWAAELSGFWRSKNVEAQMLMKSMWRADAGVSKQILKNKGSLKLSVRDIFVTQKFNGRVQYQDIDVIIQNHQNRRMATLAFTYRFGKPIKDQLPKRKTGGAADEAGRVKTGGG